MPRALAPEISRDVSWRTPGPTDFNDVLENQILFLYIWGPPAELGS